MTTGFRPSTAADGETDVARLCAEVIQASGPQKVLSAIALRTVLTGTDRALHSAALARALALGVRLPPGIAEAFGLGAVTAVPAPAPAPVGAARTDGAPGSAAVRPVFRLRIPDTAVLDFGAFDVRVLDPHARVPRRRATCAPPPNPAAPPVEALGSSTPDASVSPARTVAVPVPPVAAPTAADFDCLAYYRKQIGRRALLDHAREKELARAVEAGLLAGERLKAQRKMAPRLRRELEEIVARGGRAHTEFFEANLRLVVSIAVRYQGRGVDLLDLVQEGNLGLLHAIEMYDHELGLKFSTYATHWIRQAVRRAHADLGRTVRIPVHAHELLTALDRASHELGLDRPHDALDQVAAHAGTTQDRARGVLGQVRETVSLEALREELGDEWLAEAADRSEVPQSPADGPYGDRAVVTEEVAAAVDDLSPREMFVLSLRYGLNGDTPQTLNAIGRQLGVTRERVRQVEKKATDQVRATVAVRGVLSLPALAEPKVEGRGKRQGKPSAARRRTVPDTTTGRKAAAEARTVQPGTRPAQLSDLDRLEPSWASQHRHLVGRPARRYGHPVTVRCDVDSAGRIVVESQPILLGPRFARTTVVVIVEDDMFRVVLDGRQITTVSRRSAAGTTLPVHGTSTPA